MIKNSTYIRGFTSVQRKQMEIIEKKENLNTVPDILFFALENYLELKTEVDRLNRIIQYKQNKIEKLVSSQEIFNSAADKIHELSIFFKHNNT